MNIATTLRYCDLKSPDAWSYRYYIMHDYMLMAQKYGIGMCAVMTEYDCERIAEQCSGLIIPGSGTNINPKYYGGEDKPEIVDEYALDAKLIKCFLEKGKPIFGVCGGHQELNIYFGGTIRKVATGVSHSGEGLKHNITIEKGSFVYDVFGTEKAETNTFHGWEIGELAPDLRAVAWSEDGVIEAVENKTLKVFATQWHPEQSFHTGDPIENKFFENFLELCKSV